jgi:hypothetical protein
MTLNNLSPPSHTANYSPALSKILSVYFYGSCVIRYERHIQNVSLLSVTQQGRRQQNKYNMSCLYKGGGGVCIKCSNHCLTVAFLLHPWKYILLWIKFLFKWTLKL